jgi:hypothetical protein
MKKILIGLLFLLSSLELFAQHVYYVAATGGNDGNAGTNIAAPWATWQHAFDNATTAGDTVFFRGGTWSPSSSANLWNRIGTHDHPICFFNYPGETPIFDGSNINGGTYTILMDGCNYVKFRGLTVTNNHQDGTETVIGWSINNGGNYYFDRCVSHNNGGHGFQAFTWDTLTYLNCDSYNNYDPNTDGNTSDGFAGGSGGTVNDTLKVSYYTGCRAWHNSDDGFDIGSTKQTYLYNCWAFLNGYPADSPFAEGDGLKCGPSHTKMPTKRVFQNCISAGNKGAAFSHNNMRDEYYGPVQLWNNNTAFDCRDAWFFPYSDSDPPYNPATGFGKVIINNNVVYSMREYKALPFVWGAYFNAHMQQHTNDGIIVPDWDYYTEVITVTSADFVSVDTAAGYAQMRATRKADGSLPDITFLTLAPTSDLINAGTDVGIPYVGAAPDLGWKEYDPATGVTIRKARIHRWHSPLPYPEE